MTGIRRNRLASAGWAAALLVCFGAPVRAADPSTSGRVQDLERARTEYVEQSRAFSSIARARAQRYIERVRPGVERLSEEQFLLCLYRIAAFADNGHDAPDAPPEAWWPRSRLPFRMIWFPQGWVIARADPAHAQLLGARVLSIERLRQEQLFRRLRDLAEGPDNLRRWNLEFVIEQGGLLHALGLAKRADRLEFRLRLPDGRIIRRTEFYVPSATVPPGQWPERVWSPAPWPGEAQRGWQALTWPATPLYLEDGGRLFRAVPLGGLGALYLQMRAHFDAAGETIADFRRRVEESIALHRPRHLIVDLRFDTGGDIDLTRDWQRSLVASIPGRIYVLIGRYTFSAGIVAVAAFKHDAPARVRLVGEPVGDRLRWWSEGQGVCLPNSHYCLHATTGLWDLVHGCAGEPGCYGDQYQVQVPGLAPDIEAPLSAEAWLAGLDPALEAIARELSPGS